MSFARSAEIGKADRELATQTASQGFSGVGVVAKRHKVGAQLNNAQRIRLSGFDDQAVGTGDAARLKWI